MLHQAPREIAEIATLAEAPPLRHGVIQVQSFLVVLDAQNETAIGTGVSFADIARLTLRSKCVQRRGSG